jgi:hypothetical protein
MLTFSTDHCEVQHQRITFWRMLMIIKSPIQAWTWNPKREDDLKIAIA